MYSEIENTIVNALKKEFRNDPVLKPDMIMPAIVLKNPKEEVPPHLPAIRVVFTDASIKEPVSLDSLNYEASLKYSIFFFFKTFFFKLGNQSFDAYLYLQRIINTLKNLETPKGILKVNTVSLLGGGDFFAYAVECEVNSII